MKIAINRCFGGFSLSDAAFEKLVGMPIDEWYAKDWGAEAWQKYKDSHKGSLGLFGDMHHLPDNIERHDPRLIAIIEEMGSGHRTGASGACANLQIVEIPDGVEYVIEEYDGNEHIAEKHRTWA